MEYYLNLQHLDVSDGGDDDDEEEEEHKNSKTKHRKK
jgi:hypothetical protein